jgi:hypothetical protein
VDDLREERRREEKRREEKRREGRLAESEQSFHEPIRIFLLIRPIRILLQ